MALQHNSTAAPGRGGREGAAGEPPAADQAHLRRAMSSGGAFPTADAGRGGGAPTPSPDIPGRNPADAPAPEHAATSLAGSGQIGVDGRATSTASTRPDLVSGPHDYYSTEKPPSRGQHATIAQLACELLRMPLATRYDATVAAVRLRAAVEQNVEMPEIPTW